MIARPGESAFASFINAVPKYALSSTLVEQWPPTTLLEGDVSQEVARSCCDTVQNMVMGGMCGRLSAASATAGARAGL